jgi:beta-ureidopropionase / N-carbamoyl-L-amino-acid hydrolase
MWAALEPVGRSTSTGGYHRFAWTREDHDLREWFAAECARRGLDLTEDRMGNQWAWWGDPDSAAARGTSGVVTGSHLDSVPDGGAFDGPLGVVSALAALDELRDRGFEPARPIGVVNFVDEEGARFGVACAGSRVITGALSADRARSLTDADGTTMAEALAKAGRDPGVLGPDPEVLARIGAFVELHVEQGRGLVDLNHPVALGTDIWPHGRWRLDFPGEANHAGTTRLEDRRDAMLGYAHAVLAARHAAATVTEESWTPTTAFDHHLGARIRARLDGIPMLGTGAGHDAGILANAGIPTAMLFVRNPTGVSHSPKEWAEADDCLAGVRALASVLEELAGETP